MDGKPPFSYEPLFFSIGGCANFGKKIACRFEDSKINCLHKHLCKKNCLEKEKEKVLIYDCKKI